MQNVLQLCVFNTIFPHKEPAHSMPPIFPSTQFDASLSDGPDIEKTVSLQLAEQVFNYFKNNRLFRWSDANNDCEDRANAICILLDAWGIPNYKGWVFSGYFLKKNLGSLINLYNYHVAALLPVKQDNVLTYYIIDPSTSPNLETIDKWALKITATEKSYYCIRHGNLYIFPAGKIKKDNWHKRNKRNYNWTLQGLSGINGVSSKGKAQLAFKKKMVKRTKEILTAIKNEKPIDFERPFA